MKRLTTDNPQNNTEMMLNRVFVEEKEVWLRGLGLTDSDIRLMDFCKWHCIENKCAEIEDICNETLDDFGERMMDCEDCSISLLYWFAVGFAEVRNRLKKYEDGIIS
jgi:hypothetical protein